jgi:hypothetical protein
MSGAGNISIVRSESYSYLSVDEGEKSRNILSPIEDIDHSNDVDDEIDLEADLKVDHFMQNDAAVRDLHPGSRTPEKGFLERHKVLGVFLIGAAAILSVGFGAAGYTVALTALVGPFSGLVAIPLLMLCSVAFAGTFKLIELTFKQNIRAKEATRGFEKFFKQGMGDEEAKAKTKTTKEIFRDMETVMIYRSRSIAEVDFLVKYSQLPDDLKRDLLTRFFRERTKKTESPATLLKNEEREFQSTQKLHNGLLDTLSTRLRIDRADIPVKGDESWGDYYKDIFAIVKENTFYQALPKERRDEIEALSAHPATQLFHASQDLQAVEEAVREGATKVLQEQVLDAITATRTEQVASGAEAMQQWMTSNDGQKAINERLTALKRTWTYVPIIPRTPLPAH